MMIQYPEPRIPTKAARTEDSICTADINMNCEHSHRCLWDHLGLGCPGSLTAQLFPQLSCPKHPQQSSLWSPMNTAAGMSTWVRSKQTTLFLLASQTGQIKHSLWISFIYLFSWQSARTGDSALLLFNTVGISLLTSTLGQIYFCCHFVAILRLSTERDCWGIATAKVFQL